MIYCDLDGVLVDFSGGLSAITGKEYPKRGEYELGSEEWDVVDKGHFFRDLPWISGGKELWEMLAPYNPVILTGLPRGKTAKGDKKAWVYRELGHGVKVICCKSRDKKNYAKPGDILIDDREDNIRAWEEVGGVGVLWKGRLEDLAGVIREKD